MRRHALKRKLLVIDVETGGLNPDSHSILSLGAVVVKDGSIDDMLYLLVNEGQIVIGESANLKVSGLTVEQVRASGVSPTTAVGTLNTFLDKNSMHERTTLCAHNAWFDVGFLKRLYRLGGGEYEKRFHYRHLCTQTGALLLEQAGRIELPGHQTSLEALCEYWSIPLSREGGHHALNDAVACAQVLRRELQLIGGLS